MHQNRKWDCIISAAPRPGKHSQSKSALSKNSHENPNISFRYDWSLNVPMDLTEEFSHLPDFASCDTNMWRCQEQNKSLSFPTHSRWNSPLYQPYQRRMSKAPRQELPHTHQPGQMPVTLQWIFAGFSLCVFECYVSNVLERKTPSIIVQVWKDSFAEEGKQNLELTIMQKRKKKKKRKTNNNQNQPTPVFHMSTVDCI